MIDKRRRDDTRLFIPVFDGVGLAGFNRKVNDFLSPVAWRD